MAYRDYALAVEFAGPFGLVKDFHKTHLQRTAPGSGPLDVFTRGQPQQRAADGCEYRDTVGAAIHVLQIHQLQDASFLKKAGARIVPYFVVTTSIAVVLGITVATVGHCRTRDQIGVDLIGQLDQAQGWRSGLNTNIDLGNADFLSCNRGLNTFAADEPCLTLDQAQVQIRGHRIISGEAVGDMNDGESCPMRTSNFGGSCQYRIIRRELSHSSEDVSCLIQYTTPLIAPCLSLACLSAGSVISNPEPVDVDPGIAA